ncbi:hypothetical protein KC332_g13346 [Hortaea werneckii]|nr:hypothetical protein KC358_g13325 [Hortaea werneckii]KAI6809385.1 hypothetical protein KC350_g12970 [Hortaea werneckii]KAI6910011.1 hypothetical protein KC348_g13343 [Hortaea werneckii]KAI6926060.1 hypothetical protein KC341_g13008 [Hortaea werneckii]KAI6959823.1 hypothetical protein KC321_g13199 [Hortaea werneckii]
MDVSAKPQDDLNAMWMDFVKHLDIIEGTQHPNSSQAITGVQDVEARLAKLQLHKGDSGEKTKESLLKSLHCVQFVGQIAAQGATIAFGPAEACFGAANLVIDGLRNALRTFDDLPELLSRMTGFLVLLEEKLHDAGHYRQTRAVRETCYLVLQHFLHVLTFIHRATSGKWERFKARWKVALLGENEVQIHLTEMEKLIGRFTEGVIVETSSGVNRLHVAEPSNAERRVANCFGRPKLCSAIVYLSPTTPDPNELFIDMARDLSKNITPRSQPPRLRLLLSGRPAFFQSFKILPPEHQFPHPRYAHIRERRNAKDLALFIGYRLIHSNLPDGILQQVEHIAVEDLPAFELYPRLTNLLDEICKEHRENKISLLLKQAQATAHQEPIDAVEARVAVVNNELAKSKISELNVILAWFVVLGTDELVQLELLHQEIKLHDEHIGDESLGLLENRIQKYHHHFFGIEKSAEETYVLMWDNLDVRGYMDRQKRVAIEGKALSEERGVQPTVSAPPRLSQDEVERVRKRLKNLLSAHTYEHFGFDGFLDSKLSPTADNRSSKVHVRLERNQAHVRVVRTCLDAICDHTTDSAFHLVHNFATHSLTSQLQSIDLEKMSKKRKVDIGLKSLQLFHDRRVMGGWWTEERIRQTEIGSLCQAVARLWRDEDVMAAIEGFEGDKDLALAIARNETPVSSLLDAILKS